MMLPLFDARWATLRGGYRVPCDPSEALSRFERGEDVWSEFWNELHHQGDVGEASYAAVPHLVRIAARAAHRPADFYALVSTIEIERHRRSNPPVPDWLFEDYVAALRELQTLALLDLPLQDDLPLVQAILAALALCRGQLKLGALLGSLDGSELDELVENQLAWGNLYAGEK